MRSELDKQLCEKYPKIFKDRYADMRTTAMCWGFEHGSGWFNIIDLLCGQIQGHIDWRRKQRARDLVFNRALKRALAGDKDSLIKYFSYKGKVSDYTMKSVEDSIKEGTYRDVPEKIYQVVASQIKEKFGTLRFYYNGGDEYIHGLVAMAETMSARTCESCGAPAKSTNNGWITTMCQPCIDSREERRQQALDEYNAKHEDVYQKMKDDTHRPEGVD
jgi:hypothetical protein